MPRNSLETNSLETNLLKTISSTQAIVTEITRRPGNHPPDNIMAAPSVAPAMSRAMFMGRPCMAFDCMCEAISVCGIEADFCSIEDQITKPGCDYDAFVVFLRKCEPGMPALIEQRMSELRACMPRIPTMALLDDANVDAAALYQLGFSTVIMGLPSLNFAVTTVQLLLHGARSGPMIDRTPVQTAAAVRHRPECGQADHLVTTRSDISFTKRELDLIELLRSGKPNKLIAHKLDISESTVKAHLRNIMTKLRVKNRTHAVCMLAGELGRSREAVPA
jgi:DNA-binding NarL/FixJ family response regulator